MFNARKRLGPALALTALLLAALLLVGTGGCAKLDAAVDRFDAHKAERVEALKATRDRVVAEVGRAEAAVTAVKASLEVLPPGPERDRALKVLADAEALVRSVKNQRGVIDQAIAAVEREELTPELVAQLNAVPGVGPYLALGGTALSVIAWLYRQNRRRRREAEAAAGEASTRQVVIDQLVTSVENLGPRTEGQKMMLASKQDDWVQDLVEQTKARLGLTKTRLGLK